MRFYMVDRIISLTEGKEIIAKKVVSLDENFVLNPVNGDSYLEESLMFEALCQAGAWLIMKSTNFQQRAVLLSVDEIEWIVRVYPGQELILHGEVESLHENAAVFSGSGYIDNQCVMRANNIMCSLIPVKQLEKAEEAQRTFDILYREGKL